MTNEALPAWAVPSPPLKPVKKRGHGRDQVLPNVRVTQGERDRMTAIAKELGVTLSELVRRRALGETI